MDLATESPASAAVSQVLVNITGLEFRTASGGTAKLEFSAPEPVQLTSYADGNALRLFTDEELSEGTYTGVRLLFEDSDDIGSLTDATGAQFPIRAGEGDYAPIDVKVEEDSSSRDSVTLTLDLRQSLTFDDDNDEYTLTPILRSVVTEDAGGIQGTVDAVCTPGDLNTVAAVYLFQGADIVADDHDGAGVEPYGTTPVVSNGSGTFSYAFRFLPAGEYSIALACDGNQEDPSDDDDLDFQAATNVTVEEGETLTHNM
jgi:hypothetical protein